MQKRTHVFSISYNSDVDDCVYAGTFRCRKLAVQDFVKLSALKSKYNGGMYYNAEKPGIGVDQTTDSFSHMLAHLELVLTDKPDWWNLESVGDIGVVTAVFEEVAKFENSFRKRQSNDADGISEDDGDTAGEKSNASGKPRAVVGREVPSALEP